MSEDSDCLFHFGSFVFSETSHALLFNGKPVRLSRRAAGILGYLIQNRDCWVTRQELKALFWKKVSVEDNSVDQQISNLRHALDIEPGGKSYIETQYGSGWKFIENPKKRSGAGQPAVDQLQPAVAGRQPPTPAPLHGTLVG